MSPVVLQSAALEKRQKREDLALEEYKDWEDSGNSLLMVEHYAEALDKYQEAQKLVSKERFPREWTTIRMLLGRAKMKLGQHTEGDRGNVLLQEANRDYNEALEVFTRKDHPQGWALTQTEIASTLDSLGTRRPQRSPGCPWRRPRVT